MAHLGVLLSDDLLFASRITGTARALGLELCTLRTPQAIHDQTPAPTCVIVDLNLPGLDVAALVAAVKRKAACTVVGYGSHVAAEVLHQARAAGCDVVMPRSQFVEALPTEMAAWFGAPHV